MEQDTLRALLDTEAPRPLPPERSLAILGAVSDALFPLHAAGRAYGVFGPESVLVTDDGARLADEPVADELHAAPEVRDGGAPTTASDAYAYAVLAHRLLAGAPPAFAADGAPLPVAEQHPGFPSFAGEAIARSLQADPSLRPLPKVLATLLQVVPLDRWPTEPPPVAEEAGQVEPEAVETEAAETEAVETEAVEPEAAPGSAAPDTVETPVVDDRVEQRTARNAEFHEAVAVRHAVPDIDWAHEPAGPHDVPAIDWSADQDPTRPSDEVPSIAWSALDDGEPGAEEKDGDVQDLGDPLAQIHPVPRIAPLEEAIPEEELEHHPGRRVRRKRREWSNEQMQKTALVLLLLVLLLVGVVYALTHGKDPQYDPTLQGASRSLSHPSPARE